MHEQNWNKLVPSCDLVAAALSRPISGTSVDVQELAAKPGIAHEAGRDSDLV